tara:strand:+ start:1319 stop:1612 length:294 start_codon:yes stop_codon:yes gene_type:complete
MRTAYRDKVAGLFRASPGAWIDGLTVASRGGAYAWRTRVSDCRVQLGMVIENRVRALENGSKASEYRYMPADEFAVDLAEAAAIRAEANGEGCVYGH